MILTRLIDGLMYLYLIFCDFFQNVNFNGSLLCLKLNVLIKYSLINGYL